MSMIGYLTQLTPAQLTSIQKAPKTITVELDGSPTLCLGKMWNGLQFLLENYYPPERRSDSDDDDVADGDDRAPDSDDVPFPELLDQAVIGGDLTGPDLGYGPACVLSPDDVQQLAAELASVDGAALREAFDPGEMRSSDIYPSSIWSEGEPVLHELMLSFVDLVAFYQQAAAAGNGVATYLS